MRNRCDPYGEVFSFFTADDVLDALLVCEKSREQEIREIVKKLEETGKTELL